MKKIKSLLATTAVALSASLANAGQMAISTDNNLYCATLSQYEQAEKHIMSGNQSALSDMYKKNICGRMKRGHKVEVVGFHGMFQDIAEIKFDDGKAFATLGGLIPDNGKWEK